MLGIGVRHPQRSRAAQVTAANGLARSMAVPDTSDNGKARFASSNAEPGGVWHRLLRAATLATVTLLVTEEAVPDADPSKKALTARPLLLSPH